MSKAPTSVRSIRLRDEVWAALVRLAESEQTTVNALLARAAEDLTEDNPRAVKIVARALSHAMSAASSVPWAGDVQRKPYQKGQKR